MRRICMVGAVLLFILFQMVSAASLTFAESKTSKQQIEELTGRKVNDIKITKDSTDTATVSAGIAVSEIVSKFSVLVFFISFLVLLVGKVVQHPGKIKYARLISYGAILCFITARVAPIVLYGI